MTDMDDEFKVDLDNVGDFKSYSPESKNKIDEYIVSNSSHVQPTHLQNPAPQGCTRFLSLSFYQPYFNVTQIEILTRVRGSLTPWKQDFFQNARNHPDLYGPFWILTTIIFLLCSAGNLSRYFNNLDKQQFLFRLELLRYSVIIIYGFGFGFPALLGATFKLFASQMTIAQMICLYGYSLSCFIPILALCIIPASVLQWILMVYGIINSTLFMILNLRGELQNIPQAKKFIVYGIIGAFQITLVLLFKLLFFSMIYS